MLKSQSIQFLDLKKQYREYKPAIDQAIQKVLDSSQYILGPEVTEIEQTLSKFVDVKHCITVSSGTDSLLIALLALDLKPEDEVITTPFTWISTSEVITFLGAKPVFVDIELDTFNMDPTLLEATITDKTKAIMPVSLFGLMAEYTVINAIASRYNLPVIEDGAQSFGASYRQRKSMSMTTIGSTSFFPSKTFGCYGDGGALFTNNDNLAEKMRAIRVHGGLKKHHHNLLGINGRFDTIQAAILLAKFPFFEKEIEGRVRIGNYYTKKLHKYLTTPIVRNGYQHVYGQYTLRVSERDLIIESLKKNNIPHAIYYPKCLHEQPIFKYLGYTYGSFPKSEQASQEVLSLPMHPWLTIKEQDHIIETIISNF